MGRTSTNGWRDGRDPIQRWLRIVTAITCLAVFVFLSVAGQGGADRLATLTLALGAVLTLLGYEGALRLPALGNAATAIKDAITKDAEPPPTGDTGDLEP